MRRGFKAEAGRLALELRMELGLDSLSQFDPYAMADLYGIQVVKLSGLESDARNHFLNSGADKFSGALIPNGTGVIILENDAHSPQRRRSTMCHELSHVVLEHEFGLSLTQERSCGLAGEQEEQAGWLGAELLIPKDAAIRMARNEASDSVVAATFGVSTELARWRMGHSGARLIAARSKAKFSKIR